MFRLFYMLATIQFHHEHAFPADEVGNERINRMLANKLHAVHGSVAKQVPKAALCVRLIAAQSPSLG